MRIMSWNIERFGVNKFLENDWDTLALRQLLITKTVQTAHPDVLVIIEVQTAAAEGFGSLISDTSGGPATMALLTHLQSVFPGDGWAAVPPVIISPPGTAYREGIAVLFKSQALTFQGPWTNTAAGIIPPTVGAPPIPYTGLWEIALPAEASGLGVNQNCLAGQFAFFVGNVRLEYGGFTARSLWRTRFLQKANGRHLDIFSLHFPPAAYLAIQALGEVALTPEIAAPLGAAEDRVILGDFNINVNSPAQAAAFQQLRGETVPAYPVTYQLQFPPGPATSLVRVFNAFTNGVPPYYGYASANAAGQWLGLDNALVARGGGAAAPENQAVLDAVAEATPYFDMVNTIPAINTLHPGAPRYQRFNTLVNFGHIGGGRGASDHMPIVFDLP